MINIRETFLSLTKRRYPKGTEDLAMDIVKEILPNVIFEKDEFNNYFTIIKLKNGSNPSVMFTSHLDTIDSGPTTYGNYYNGKKWDNELKMFIEVDKSEIKVDDKSVKHVFDGDFVKTDGNSNLGADDKAGVTILMNMISEKVPGLYYFFMGEESGCVGSSNLSRVFETKDFPKVNKCISFDRKAYNSIITHQHGVCCSDDFANELANRYNEYGFWFKPDPTGIYTDSAEFTDIIEECTNISVGYFDEHYKTEKQDLEFLELLSVVSTQINWETLPIVRTKDSVYSGKKSKTYGQGWDWNSWGDDYMYGGNNYTSKGYTQSTNYESHKSYKNTPKVDDNIITNDFDFDKWYNEQRQKV